MTEPSTAPLLTPAQARRAGRGWVVTVQGVTSAQPATKAAAIAHVCSLAVQRGEPFVLVVLEGGGKSYLSISALGEVTPSTAPASANVRPDLSPESRPDLGTAEGSEDDMRAWVEQTMLDPDTAPTEPAKRPRFRFRR